MHSRPVRRAGDVSEHVMMFIEDMDDVRPVK